MFMRIFSQTRYIVLLPVLGLFLATAYLFLTGGFGLIVFLFDALVRHGLASHPEPENTVTIMEFVEQFLTGTVLYIVAVGLYGLFIRQLNVPAWLRIDSLDELKHTVIGIVVAVLAVKFMGVVAEWDDTSHPLEIGAAIGIVTAGLGIYMGLVKGHRKDVHPDSRHAETSTLVEFVQEGKEHLIADQEEESSA